MLVDHLGPGDLQGLEVLENTNYQLRPWHVVVKEEQEASVMETLQRLPREQRRRGMVLVRSRVVLVRHARMRWMPEDKAARAREWQ